MSVVNIPGIIRGGQVEKYGVGDRITGTVGAGQAATGGLLIEAMTGDRVVRTAQTGSLVCWGIAVHDALAGVTVTIAAEGVWMLTPTAAAIGAGNKVVVGGAGIIIVAGAAPDARTIVGRAISDLAASTPGPVKLTV